LVGRSKKYRDRFGIQEFNLYTEYVLEQDIARAALAISLHSLKEDERTKVYPKIYPIDFEILPLTFLLILVDELQEYLRWEGTAIKRNLKFNYHPKLEVKVSIAGSNISNIQLKVLFSLDKNHKDYIINQAKFINAQKGGLQSISDIDRASTVIGDSIKDNLEKKLNLGKYFKLELEIYENWKRKVYGNEFSTER
jgi:hypothetical protein